MPTKHAAGCCLKRWFRDLRFAAAQPAELDFAVEYCGKEPDVPTKIARICNAGWEYVGRYGDCRYYHKPADSEAAHPSKGNYLELDRIKSAQNNLTTVLLLNIPCTVFCLAYVALFIADGFFFSDFSAYNLGYPFFLAWCVSARCRFPAGWQSCQVRAACAGRINSPGSARRLFLCVDFE